MFSIYVKIGMILATAHSVIVAYICMIGLIIKLAGSWKKISKYLNVKGGKESIIPN
jgi:hypothetical protein